MWWVQIGKQHSGNGVGLVRHGHKRGVAAAVEELRPARTKRETGEAKIGLKVWTRVDAMIYNLSSLFINNKIVNYQRPPIQGQQMFLSTQVFTPPVMRLS